jgi:hypothetical protein
MKSQNIDDKEFNPRGVLGMISSAKGKWQSPLILLKFVEVLH